MNDDSEMSPFIDDGGKKKEIILTDAQKSRILEMLMEDPERPPKIKDIIKDKGVFNKEIDAREQEGLAVRRFVAEKGLKFHKAREWVSEKNIELTNDQKSFIASNISAMKPMEMARVLFKNDKLTNLDSETREIYKYIKELPANIVNTKVPEEQINTEDYKPPKTEDQAIARIRKYVSNIDFSKEKLNEKQKRDIKNLIGYLHTMRYLSQVNTYSKAEERDLFESEMIRCTYDKALTEEEVSQYIMYCTEVIIARQIDKRVQDLEREQDRQIEENSGRPNMALVEQISALRSEFNQCINRQKVSLKSLQGERKERLKTDGQNKGNISDLIVYAQSEKKRQHLLHIAAERREKIKE